MIEFRQAFGSEIDSAWAVVDRARNNMIAIGRHQWTSQYPSREIISNDIISGNGYVLVEDGAIRAYGAVYINGEPQYEHLDGRWLTTGDYVVVHRLAVDPICEGRGLARQFFAAVEDFAVNNGIFSFKVDTNYDNGGMLHLMDALGFAYCGEVVYQNGYRKAFEKVLNSDK